MLNIFNKNKHNKEEINDLNEDIKKIIKKTIKFDVNKCSNYGISLLCFNILSPELLNFFWNKSYYLDTNLKKKDIESIFSKKIKNIKNIIKYSNCTLVGLQEVTVPVLNIEDYRTNSYTHEKYISHLKQYETPELKIAGYSFKQNPINYVPVYLQKKFNSYLKNINEKLQKNQKTYNISNNDLKYTKSADSGLVTLYNPNVLELIYSYNAEFFGLDTKKYIQFKIIKKTKKKGNKNKNHIKKTMNSFRGIGSPFVLSKFKNKFTDETFYSLNVHVKMNYPFIDSLKTIIKRINKLKRTLIKDFTWNKTIIFGDFNSEDYPKNNNILFKEFKNDKQIIKKKTINNQPLYNYFNSNLIKPLFKKNTNYNILIGSSIDVKNYNRINIPVLKININTIKDEKEKVNEINKNNELVKSDYLTSDAKPIFCYLFIKTG